MALVAHLRLTLHCKFQSVKRASLNLYNLLHSRKRACDILSEKTCIIKVIVMLSAALPLWIRTLLLGYVVPDEVAVSTKITLGNLYDKKGTVQKGDISGRLAFPGYVPEYSSVVDVEPTTTGVEYKILAKKAVGFYGVVFEALAYDKRKFNDWAFPIERRNFGFMAFMSGDRVVDNMSIHYSSQSLLCDSIISLLTPVILRHESNNLTVDADPFCCSHIAYQMHRAFTYSISFLPVYEVWQLTWQTGGEEPGDSNVEPDIPIVRDCASAIATGNTDLILVYCDSGG